MQWQNYPIYKMHKKKHKSLKALQYRREVA